jgi:hypothetical protein
LQSVGPIFFLLIVLCGIGMNLAIKFIVTQSVKAIHREGTKNWRVWIGQRLPVLLVVLT